MKLRASLLFLFCTASAYAFSGGPSATPTPGLVDKTLLFLHIKKRDHAPAPANIHHGIELQLSINPADIDLSTTRQVQATVDLYNRSKNYVHLDFPTSQRVEVLVRDGSGKVVNTWSEDQSFTNDPATLAVNPGERLQYTVSVATREMSAGQPYSIEVSFPNYPDLKVRQTVTPRK